MYRQLSGPIACTDSADVRRLQVEKLDPTNLCPVYGQTPLAVDDHELSCSLEGRRALPSAATPAVGLRGSCGQTTNSRTQAVPSCACSREMQAASMLRSPRYWALLAACSMWQCANAQDQPVRYNQMQQIKAHNAYHLAPDKRLTDLAEVCVLTSCTMSPRQHAAARWLSATTALLAGRRIRTGQRRVCTAHTRHPRLHCAIVRKARVAGGASQTGSEAETSLS